MVSLLGLKKEDLITLWIRIASELSIAKFYFFHEQSFVLRSYVSTYRGFQILK